MGYVEDFFKARTKLGRGRGQRARVCLGRLRVGGCSNRLGRVGVDESFFSILI
jgi:hypothetical protein